VAGAYFATFIEQTFPSQVLENHCFLMDSAFPGAVFSSERNVFLPLPHGAVFSSERNVFLPLPHGAVFSSERNVLLPLPHGAVFSRNPQRFAASAVLRIYASYAHIRIGAECADAHYAPLRIVCAEYASAHNIRGEGQRNTPLIFAHPVFSIPWFLFLFRGRRQLPQAGEVRRPLGPAW
jgi:hypothetical protein